eukprot:6577079-Lingulodinium_polyedra.AAC.1
MAVRPPGPSSFRPSCPGQPAVPQGPTPRPAPPATASSRRHAFSQEFSVNIDNESVNIPQSLFL